MHRAVAKKKISCTGNGPKKNSGTLKIPPPPPPHHFSNGPSLATSHLAFFISHLAYFYFASRFFYLAFFTLHLASFISHLAFFISHLAFSMSHLAFSKSIPHFYLASRMSLIGFRSCGFFCETFTKKSGFKSLRVKPLNDMKVERT